MQEIKDPAKLMGGFGVEKARKLEVRNPLFIDSGAHGLYNKHVAKSGYKWFKTSEFKEYVDNYCEFIKEHKEKITCFANVDVIHNPKLTWETQEYIEKEHGIKPIPVIHSHTKSKWLVRYLNKEYEYIALGGLGQKATVRQYTDWADEMFNIICDQPSRLPICKVHGFAITAVSLMRKFPWYSVDSSTWLALARYGNIAMPRLIKGEWNYAMNYNIVNVSETPSITSISTLRQNNHLSSLVKKYAKEKGVPIGKTKIKKGNKVVVKPGISNSIRIRSYLNARYFIDFTKSLPKYPWAYISSQRKFFKS